VASPPPVGKKPSHRVVTPARHKARRRTYSSMEAFPSCPRYNLPIAELRSFVDSASHSNHDRSSPSSRGSCYSLHLNLPNGSREGNHSLPAKSTIFSQGEAGGFRFQLYPRNPPSMAFYSLFFAESTICLGTCGSKVW
jgi:hypothetical protein